MRWVGSGDGRLHTHPLQEGTLELRWPRIRIRYAKLAKLVIRVF